MEKREQIRRAYFVENKSMRTIAKELHCPRDTIKKAIASPGGEPYTLTKPRAMPVSGQIAADLARLMNATSARALATLLQNVGLQVWCEEGEVVWVELA